jgi:hypothetical protein
MVNVILALAAVLVALSVLNTSRGIPLWGFRRQVTVYFISVCRNGPVFLEIEGCQDLQIREAWQTIRQRLGKRRIASRPDFCMLRRPRRAFVRIVGVNIDGFVYRFCKK